MERGKRRFEAYTVWQGNPVYNCPWEERILIAINVLRQFKEGIETRITDNRSSPSLLSNKGFCHLHDALKVWHVLALKTICHVRDQE
jgi:hypothetical protein